MHPLDSLVDWFPSCDFGVMDHGFLPHGRDYMFVVETNMGHDPGRYKLQFTHVADLGYATAVSDDVLVKSWGEEFNISCFAHERALPSIDSDTTREEDDR